MEHLGRALISSWAYALCACADCSARCSASSLLLILLATILRWSSSSTRPTRSSRRRELALQLRILLLALRDLLPQPRGAPRRTPRRGPLASGLTRTRRRSRRTGGSFSAGGGGEKDSMAAASPGTTALVPLAMSDMSRGRLRVVAWYRGDSGVRASRESRDNVDRNESEESLGKTWAKVPAREHLTTAQLFAPIARSGRNLRLYYPAKCPSPTASRPCGGREKIGRRISAAKIRQGKEKEGLSRCRRLVQRSRAGSGESARHRRRSQHHLRSRSGRQRRPNRRLSLTSQPPTPFEESSPVPPTPEKTEASAPAEPPLEAVPEQAPVAASTQPPVPEPTQLAPATAAKEGRTTTSPRWALDLSRRLSIASGRHARAADTTTTAAARARACG